MLIIMQGVPGSGKSTVALKLAKSLPAYICSTDHYFLDEDKNYVFDKSKLAEYHKLNQKQADILLKNKEMNVIIDNTNLKNYEIKSYVRSATQYGHQIIFVRCNGNFVNVHGIPQRTVDFMKQQMEELSVEKALSAITPWELSNE